MRAITTFIVLLVVLAVGLLIGVAVLDPLRQLVLTYDLGGMSGQVKDIHVSVVKWMVPAGVFTAVVWAVFTILRRERQQV